MDADQWDNDNLGEFSTAFGRDNLASGEFSFAFKLKYPVSL